MVWACGKNGRVPYGRPRLGWMDGVTPSDADELWKVRNEEMRRRAGIEWELASRADQRVLRWFGHVKRMDEYRTAKRVLMAGVRGGRVRGRPRVG